ncbi:MULTISPECIES: sugar ABC transporter ATP-binding protein [Trichococcus]|uniref:sugar ABC transporter ATP-binding protein n=1 Tax=Trichococcus TaxID=82802 RepID=UPI0029F510D1|nr:MULTISPECIES: sugar ABC transporter ATP-binding protein [Trichococcus]
MEDYVLQLEGVSKIFPGVKALDNVNFKLKAGEIHALMGENGAGKSTFIKVMTGVHQPEEGKIYLDGKEVSFKNTNDSKKAGIAAIYQHSTSYPDLSVTENIFLGHEYTAGKINYLNWKKMNSEANQLLEKIGANFDARRIMGELSVAQQQIVEIAKALSQNARIIIMDEPTASLTINESEELYKIAEDLRDQGKSIIFISHRFEDMYRLASKVSVLRDSKYIGTWDVDKISNHDLIVAMVGREINTLFPKKELVIGDTVLKVNNLSRTGYFKNINFEVKAGEIVALTGLVGAGRTEIVETIYGLEKHDEGSIELMGETFIPKSPSHALENGIGLLSENRHEGGLITELEIYKSITLTNLRKMTNRFWINSQEEFEVAKTFGERVNVKANSIFDKVSNLSGGNQQKVVLAKILTSFLRVIILDEPTKGVDVGAKAAMYEIMGELAEKGYGVILVSSEMPEVLGMSDRIIVIKEGKVSAELNTKNTSQEEILQYAMSES